MEEEGEIVQWRNYLKHYGWWEGGSGTEDWWWEFCVDLEEDEEEGSLNDRFFCTND